MGELPSVPIPDPYVPQTEGLKIGDQSLSISCAVVIVAVMTLFYMCQSVPGFDTWPLNGNGGRR